MMFPRTLLLIAILMIPGLAAAGGQQHIRASHRITAVTVYPDRAMTTRSANLTLKPGSYLVTFDGLPSLIQDDSVRVEGKGSAAVTIVGMEVKRAFVEQVPEKRPKELEDEIRALERTVGGVEAKQAALAAQKGFIDSIRVAWGDRISKELAVGKPTAAELNEAISFVGNGVARVEEQTRDLEAEKARIRERIDALRRQRDQAIGSNRKEAKVVEVALEVSREGSLTLEQSGITPNAGWEPSYDCRLGADGKSAELTFRAMVRQQTGEDWGNVNLALSTARPSVGGAPPELLPWRISFYRPSPPMPMPLKAESPRSARKSAIMREEADAGLEMYEAASVGAAPAAHLTAGVTEEQSSVSFLIPRPVTIPSDGTLHGNVVAIETLPVTLEFLAVPKLSPFVFLRSEITNRTPFPLLPGRVNGFVGNAFTGSSYLKKVASGEKFDLFFGMDDQVTVKREVLKSHKEAGLFGGNRMSYRYRIEVRNFRKEAQTVTIRDQLPLAGDEEIKVGLNEPNPKPNESGTDGTQTWRLLVSPGEKREITFGIVVEYPKERQITGL